MSLSLLKFAGQSDTYLKFSTSSGTFPGSLRSELDRARENSTAANDDCRAFSGITAVISSENLQLVILIN